MRTMTGIGAAMERARVAAGLSAAAVEKRTCVRAATVRMYERGLVWPGLYNLLTLAQCYGVGLGELIGGGD